MSKTQFLLWVLLNKSLRGSLMLFMRVHSQPLTAVPCAEVTLSRILFNSHWRFIYPSGYSVAYWCNCWRVGSSSSVEFLCKAIKKLWLRWFLKVSSTEKNSLKNWIKLASLVQTFLQGHRKFLYDGAGRGELSKNVDHHGWTSTKNLKKHWPKRRKASPKKRNSDQNINDSKSHICNSFFENIIPGVQLQSTRSTGHHQSLFLFQNL